MVRQVRFSGVTGECDDLVFVYGPLLGQPKGFDLYVCKVSFADVFIPWQGILAEDFALIDLFEVDFG